MQANLKFKFFYFNYSSFFFSESKPEQCTCAACSCSRQIKQSDNLQSMQFGAYQRGFIKRKNQEIWPLSLEFQLAIKLPLKIMVPLTSLQSASAIWSFSLSLSRFAPHPCNDVLQVGRDRARTLLNHSTINNHLYAMHATCNQYIWHIKKFLFASISLPERKSHKYLTRDMCSYSLEVYRWYLRHCINIERYLLNYVRCGRRRVCLYIKIFNYINEFVLSLSMFM